MRRAFASLLLCVPLLAQDDAALVRVEARVTAVVGGVVHLDRGAAAGIEPGDRVQVFPLGGATLDGSVQGVEDRACRVTVDGSPQAVAPGTRAEVLVPSDRLVEDGEDTPEHPGWTSQEGPWDPDVPLLARVEPPEPEEREPRWSGRWYSFVEWTDDGQYDRSHLLAREGFDARYENPLGRGGALHLDAEWNARTVDVPDGQDEDETHLRLDRLSYAWGGVRGRPRRWEIGRFLQKELPELGVLDGVETTRRLENGDRFGASAGFLPEPNETFSTGEDFQTAVYYRHVRGEREELSVAGAYQKTWHEGEEDRDLVLTGVRWYPDGPWSAWGSAWVDLYGSEDEIKGSGAELSMLTAGVGRRFGTKAGANLSLSRFRFPELLRDEFPAVTKAELADDRTDRLSLSGWHRLGSTWRLYGRVDRWEDEQASGAGGEVRLDARDVLFDGGRTSLALYTQEGRFGNVDGVRASLGGRAGSGRWDLSWDLGQHRNAGFLGEQAELDQHRLRARWDTRLGEDWDLSLHAEQRFGDEQDSVTLGFYLQRGF